MFNFLIRRHFKKQLDEVFKEFEGVVEAYNDGACTEDEYFASKEFYDNEIVFYNKVLDSFNKKVKK